MNSTTPSRLVSFLSLPLCVAPLCVALLAGCNNMGNNSAQNDATNSTGATNVNLADNSGTNYPSATNADNTGRNTRDRDNSNVTPLDQGNSPADRDTTAKIRQAVVSGTNNFSVMAQNIKIITQNGSVTLRGPVSNDSEKSSIVTLARNIAGETNVTDQLEVKQ